MGYLDIANAAPPKKRNYLDIANEAPEKRVIGSTQRERSALEYILPSFATSYKEKPGERTFLGDIFERPGAAVRSALTGKGYVAGATRPEEVPTFQDTALDKYYATRDPNRLTTQIGGLGVSTAGLAGDILTNPADLLTLLVPKAPGAKQVVGALEKTKPFQALERFGTKERHIFKTPEKIEKEAVDIYRQILRPTQGEVKTYEIKRGGNIKDPLTIAAEEQLPIEMVKEGGVGKIETTKARKIVADRIEELDAKLTDILKATEKTQPYIDLIDVKKQSLAQARKSIINDTEYNVYAKDINNYIADAIKARGRYVSGSDLNEVKRGMYSVGYSAMKPTSDKAARIIARVAKNKIEKSYPDKNVKEINDIMGKFLSLNKLLENAQGRVIAGGRIGKYFAQGIGAGVGAVAGSPIPYVGPIAGGLLGRTAGVKIAERLSSPIRLLGIAGKKASQAGIQQRGFLQALTGKVIPRQAARRGVVKAPSGINRTLVVSGQGSSVENRNIR